ncbi:MULTISPECIES: organomercurial lyase MerB [unclassified Methylibium]|uniref:organomercurial lyase MerB n=1 Tax=unclassified Methylibium TaxID=2633235 RepID=UPI0003F40531|nr:MULTISPECIES: organomercurial lyase MerB [unclassified Methylibium]MBI5270779.1 organomercurial lyase MerB [Burkholderiales bacterium]AIA99084.1 Alkylmercury lyase [Methylibium sp. T29]AIA99181.1 Alkylmercury lyase [Methylibium sp. T29-B]EWS56330.1 Alkylmercury lyase [Methylibium sp. T29]EWS60841.1 Alkylmercury lyase [Methylibium sp. T29-B]
MELTSYATEVAARLMPAERSEGCAELLVALLGELVKGHPVQRDAFAATLGWSAERLTALLEQEPCTEYDDDGNVIGYGITLRETAHAFEVDGQRLYTWCALDALMFPGMIGKTARVFSRCPATGLSVSLTVTPEGLRDVEPTSAVVSLPLLEAAPNIRSSFCCHVNFYASTSAAPRSVHQRMELVCVEDAFRVGQLIADSLTTGAAAGATSPRSELRSQTCHANP